MQKEDLILKKLEKLERIPDALDGIVDRLDTIDGRLDGVDGRFNGLTERMDGSDTRTEGLMTQTNRLGEKIDVLTETVAEVLEKLSDHDRRFDRLETTAFTTKEQVSEISADVKKLNIDMHGVVETLDAHTNMLLRLDQERVASYATLERHEEAITALQKKR